MLNVTITINSISLLAITVSVTALNGKVSWQPGTKEYHKITLHIKLQTRGLLGKSKRGLPLLGLGAEELSKRQTYIVFLGGKAPQVGFQVLRLG